MNLRSLFEFKHQIAIASASLFFTLSCFAAIPADLESSYQSLRAKASERSLEIKAAEASARQKSAQAFVSLTDWLPRVDLTFAQSRSKDYSFVSSGALGSSGFQFTPVEVPLSRWSFNASLPLYKRSVHLGFLQSRSEESLADNQLLLKQVELDWRLRSLLADYLLQIYKIATLQNSIKLAQTNTQEAKLRFELGSRTRVDLLRAEANLASLQSNEIAYADSRDVAKNALLEYSGLNNEELAALEFPDSQSEDRVLSALLGFTDFAHLLPKVDKYLGQDPEKSGMEHQLTEQSPVYRGYRIQEELDERRARALSSREWPELLAQASLSKQGGTWDDAFSPGQQSYSYGVQLTIPIFSSGSIFGSIRADHAAQELGRIHAVQDETKLHNQLESDRLRILSLQRLLDSQKLGVQQNEEIVRLSFKSYQLGKATIVELLGSQNDLIESKMSRAKTQVDLSTAVRRFAWNLGISLSEL